MAMADDERQKMILAYAEAACTRAFEALGVKNSKEFCELMHLPYAERGPMDMEDMKLIWRELIKKRLNLEWIFLGLGPEYITEEEITEELINKKIDEYYSRYCVRYLQ